MIYLTSLLASPSLAKTLDIPVDLSYYQSLEFAKEFTGTYGFLSPVEATLADDERALLEEVRALMADGDFTGAEELVSEFIKNKREPKDKNVAPSEVGASMIFNLGNLYMSNDKPADAERAFKIALKKKPNFRRAWKNLGLLYFLQDKLDLALEPLQKAVELGDGNHRSYGLLGYAYLRQEKYMGAETAYREAFLRKPDQKDWKQGIVQAVVAQERYQEGAAILEELISEFPDNTAYWTQLATCYIQLEKKEEAITTLELMRFKNLAGNSELNLLGNLYMDQELSGLALDPYVEALEFDDTFNLDSYLDIANILVATNSLVEAENYLTAIYNKGEEALTDAEKIELKLINIGIAKARENEALVWLILEEINSLDPSNGFAMIERGQYFERQARAINASDEDKKAEQTSLYGKARTQFKNAINKEETAYEGNKRYGQMLVRNRQFQEAIPFLETAQKLKPSDSFGQWLRQVQRAAKRSEDLAKK